MAKNKFQKITSCLWFDTQAEEAVNFYTSLFKNSSIGTTMRYNEAAAQASGQPAGTVMTITFELEGHEFLALNGGPIFKFNHAVSFIINCEDQEEIDFFWEKLSEGGEKEPCGWVRDKFGLSWQVVPAMMEETIKNGDPEGVSRMMSAVMGMKKLDIAAMRKAYEGE